MPIVATCSNGHELKLAETFAGKRIRCPHCSVVVAVPLSKHNKPTAEDKDVFDELIAEDRSKEKSQRRAKAKKEAERERILKEQEAQDFEQRKLPDILIPAAGVACGAIVAGAIGWLLLLREPPAEKTVAVKPPPTVPDSNMSGVEAPDPREAESVVPAPNTRPRESAEPFVPPDGLAIVRANNGNEGDEPIEGAFRLPEAISAIAYNETSGVLLTSRHALPGFTAYKVDDITADKLSPFAEIKTSSDPQSAVARRWAERDLFLCATSKGSTLLVLDAETCERVEEIPIESPYIDSITRICTSPNPIDPYVYLIGTVTGENSNNLCRFDLRTRTIESVLRDQSVRNVRLNATGDKLAIYSTPANRLNLRVVAWPPTATGKTPNLITYGSSSSRWIQDSQKFEGLATKKLHFADDGHGIITGSELCGEQLTTVHPGQGFDLHAFFRNGIGIGQENNTARDTGAALNKVVLTAPGGFKRMADYPVPDWRALSNRWQTRTTDVARKQYKANRAASRSNRMRDRQATGLTLPVYVADNQRNLIVGVFEDYIQVRNLSSLDIASNQTQPLKIAADLPTRVLVGKSIEIPIRIQGAESLPNIEIVVKPDGSPLRLPETTDSVTRDGQPRIEGDTFLWTPQSHQVGTRCVHLRTTSGSSSRDWVWDFRVEYPSEPIPFRVAGAAIHADGKTAILWGSDNGKRIIATYDVDTQKVLKQVPFFKHVSFGTVSEKYVYLVCSNEPETVSRRGFQLVQLFRDTLAERRAITTGRTNSNELAVAGGVLSFLQNGQVVRSISADDLSELTERPTPSVRRVRYHWESNGVLWDQQHRRAELLISPSGFRTVPPTRWKAWADLMPPRMLVSWEPKHNKRLHHLAFISPFDSGSRRQTDLFATPRVDPKLDKPLLTTVSGAFDKVLTVANGAAYVVPYPETKDESNGLRIEPRQSTSVLSALQPMRVKYSASEPCEWTLKLVGSGTFFEAQSNDGSFIVRVSDLAKAIGNARRSLPTDAEDMVEYKKKIAPRFRELTGKTLRGVPVFVTATVTATSEGRQAKLVHGYFVDVPVSTILKKSR